MFEKLIMATSIIACLTSCYKNVETDNIEKTFEHNNLKAWNGVYKYSNYKTNESTGTGIGESYTLTVADNKCNIDIVGYQVDKHFACYLNTTKKPNYIDVYDLDRKIKFGEVKRTNINDYSIKITYFDKYNEPDNNFYSLERR